MTVPPIPDHRRIPTLNNFIQDLLRDPPPVMILDMGLGSREQGFSAQMPKRVPVTAIVPGETDIPPRS